MADSDNAPITYWRADKRFAGLVTGFHRFRIPFRPGATFRDVFFPGDPVIRFGIEQPQPWSLQIGSRRFDMPLASFSGPTNVAGWAQATGGTVVGVGLRAVGWARLFGGDLSGHANRVVPLSALDPTAERVREALNAGDHPPAVLERWLDERLAADRAVDPLVPLLEAAFDDVETMRIEALAERVGMTPRQFAARTRQHFGFTPKLLLRRRRFLRALSGTLDAPPDTAGALLAEAGYWDRSHFLRDAHLFLGCSIREFRQRRGPFHALAMQARAAAFGAAV